jgi:hypothetical protein
MPTKQWCQKIKCTNQLSLVIVSLNKLLMKCFVAHVQRRGDRPPQSYVCIYLENMERQGILVSYQWENRMGVLT